MGYGTLLFGYFLTYAFSLSRVYFFTDIIGSLVMLWAFSKLIAYNRYYRGAAASGIVFTALCICGCVTMFLRFQPEWFTILVNCLKAAASCALHVFTLLGIRGIAKGADAPRLAETALRNLVMMGLYYALYYIVLATSPLYPDMVSYISFVVYLYWFVAFFCNLVLFYRCFGTFYPAEGDPMAQTKKSRFAFVNKLNEKFDELDEKANAYRRESMEMAMEEAKRRAEEKEKHPKNKHSKKKK